MMVGVVTKAPDGATLNSSYETRLAHDVKLQLLLLQFCLRIINNYINAYKHLNNLCFRRFTVEYMTGLGNAVGKMANKYEC